MSYHRTTHTCAHCARPHEDGYTTCDGCGLRFEPNKRSPRGFWRTRR